MRIPERDLEEVAQHVGARWETLRGQTLFLTGATGFVGQWLLESLVHANRTRDLKLRAWVLSRDAKKFLSVRPHFQKEPALQWVSGDIRNFTLPGGPIDFVLHGAAQASLRYLAEQPLDVMDTIYNGTRRVLDVAKERGAKRLLFVSSGAVYGGQPPESGAIPEDSIGAPRAADARSAYGEAKRAAELACHLVTAAGGPVTVAARLFALVGAHCPLGEGYAAGDFLNDALQQKPAIEIQGDGSDVRSYLYAGDVAAWLWSLLLEPSATGAYNVGSDKPVSIRALAEAVTVAAQQNARAAAPMRVEVRGKSTGRTRHYLPNVDRAKSLGLASWTPLPDALERTLAWFRELPTT